MEDLYFYIFLASAFVFGLLIMGIAVWYFGFKRIDQDDGPGYSVVISNRLFKVQNQLMNCLEIKKVCYI